MFRCTEQQVITQLINDVCNDFCSERVMKVQYVEWQVKFNKRKNSECSTLNLLDNVLRLYSVSYLSSWQTNKPKVFE